MARTRITPDWQPSDEDYLFCEANRPDLNVREVILQFRTYWLAQPMKAGEKANWSRTWRNWVARARAKPTYAPRQFETAKDQSRRLALEQLTGGRQDACNIIDI
jgi:hypothetical protein